ncbi:MAG: peptidase MA family metallohydrolase [Myxococcota bacterium]
MSRSPARHNPPHSARLPARLLGAAGAAAVLLLGAQAAGESFVWVDEDGVTHLSNRPPEDEAPRLHEGDDVESLRALWGDHRAGPAISTPAGASGGEDDRATRLLRAAVHDLKRGETARAGATLRSVARLAPERPEAHWYLALLSRQRGRYDAAAEQMRAFLSRAGPELAAWRERAERALAALDDERRLADESRPRGRLQLASYSSDHFRLQVDRDLGGQGSAYATRAMGFLEDARLQVSEVLGVEPEEPLGVVFYGKAAYQQAHAHRFSFRTVGFFDGRIHVSSPAHPSDELRSLLFHEYTHAVFREQTGGDRPYWLNEGLAEQIEREARRQPVSTRSERASLNARLRDGRWIPLRRLGPSFSGLSDDDARAAYLQAIVAVQWLEANTTRDQRARLLAGIGRGLSADQALYEILGLDVDGVDAAVQDHVRSEFPEI